MPGVILLSGSEVQRTNGSYTQVSPEKNFQIIYTSFPCLHLDLERQCVFPRDLASAPFPLHAEQLKTQRHFSWVWHGLNLPLLGVVHDRKVGGFSAVTQCRVLW